MYMEPKGNQGLGGGAGESVLLSHSWKGGADRADLLRYCWKRGAEHLRESINAFAVTFENELPHSVCS